MKAKTFGMEVTKTNLPLILVLNNGQMPEIKAKTWFIITIDPDGTAHSPDIITEREMVYNYNIQNRTPFVVPLKKISQ